MFVGRFVPLKTVRSLIKCARDNATVIHWLADQDPSRLLGCRQFGLDGCILLILLFVVSVCIQILILSSTLTGQRSNVFIQSLTLVRIAVGFRET